MIHPTSWAVSTYTARIFTALMANSKRQLLIINDSSQHSPELELFNTHQHLSKNTKNDDCSPQHPPELPALMVIWLSHSERQSMILPNTHQNWNCPAVISNYQCSLKKKLPPELESSSTHGHQQTSIFDHWCFLKTILFYSITKQPPPTRTRIFQHSWSSAACQLLHEHCVELFFLGRVGSGRGRSKIDVAVFSIITAALQTNWFVLHLPGVGPFPPLLDSSHDNQNKNCLQTTCKS